MKDTKATDLATGTRIYYTGDRANMEGVFVVVAQNPSAFYGTTFDLREVGDCCGDAPREIKGLLLSSFQSGPGRRFQLYDDWKAERAAKIAASAAAMRRVMACTA